MASQLPAGLTIATEVCSVRGGVIGNQKTDSLGQVCFWIKLSGMQKRGDASGPLFKILKLLFEHPQCQQQLLSPPSYRQRVSMPEYQLQAERYSRQFTCIAFTDHHKNSTNNHYQDFHFTKKELKVEAVGIWITCPSSPIAVSGGDGIGWNSCLLDSKSHTMFT